MMQKEDAPSTTRSPPDFLPMEAVFRSLVDYLEAERLRIFGEIRSYPMPIPACDAQFNDLLEQRTKLNRELNRLYAIEKKLRSAGSGEKLLRAFIASSECIDSDMKRQLATVFREPV